jgi:hypothetical protein
MGGELLLRVAEEGADTERLAALAGYLRAELLQLPLDNVVTVSSAELPPLAKGTGSTAVSALLVALGQSAEGLRALVSAVGEWLRRGQGTGRTVRLELDGDTLELSQASKADQERLVELFVSRHAPAKGRP